MILGKTKFNGRNQREGETADQYITVVYSMDETCKYGNLTEEMLRDRLVVGIKDNALSEYLQTDPELTIEKAKKAVRQGEAVKEQRQQLIGDGSKKNPIVLEMVKSSC